MLPDGFDIMPGVGGELFTGSRSSAAGLNRPLWAKITDSAGTNPVRYAWQEQAWQQLPAGNANTIGLARADGGMYGTAALNPAIEPNGTQLNVGDFVLVQRAYFDPTYDWVFAVVAKGGAGSGVPISSVVSGGSQSVMPSTSTPISWGLQRGPFTNASFLTRLTIPASQPANGIYTMIGDVYFNAIGINYHISARWCLNGSYSNPIDETGLCDGLNGEKVDDPAWFQMNPGDYVELAVWHDAPAAVTINGLFGWIDYRGVY